MRNLIAEIKKGQVGTGLLVENDGYISPSSKENMPLFESIVKNMDTDFEHRIPDKFIVYAVFQKFGIENANGRIYPEDILKREVDKYQQAIQERRSYGELNHPSESCIDLGRIAILITELHWENHTLVGQIEIPVSEGFRKLGIVSTCADMLAQWLISGLKVGVSSRALGSVKQGPMGKLIVQDDLELVCWDAVSQPSTPGSYIDKYKDNLNVYVENEKKEGEIIREDRLSKFEKWLND